MTNNTLEADLALQESLLPGVSRTFALTIPELPGQLRVAVTNAYLLCRIADTIEDDAELEAEDKQRFHEQFVAVVAGHADPEALADALYPALSEKTPAEERDLIQQIPAVVRVTHSLNPAPRQALERCVRVMCAGMPQFQRKTSIHGLNTVKDLEEYCYYVAGVVGEMLTELFADHSTRMATRRAEMMSLAVS
ncbi:MAG: squalene/phytoene synthase family protein, partial [Xanthomonadales bacterium]|nr:squalene/phytoene synthase family protein [Xanthomonadales bacterium]